MIGLGSDKKQPFLELFKIIIRRVDADITGPITRAIGLTKMIKSCQVVGNLTTITINVNYKTGKRKLVGAERELGLP